MNGICKLCLEFKGQPSEPGVRLPDHSEEPRFRPGDADGEARENILAADHGARTLLGLRTAIPA